MTAKKPDPQAVALEQDLAALEAGAGEEYTPDTTGDRQTPTAPGTALAADGRWHPNPARIARFKPKAGMFYALLCKKWADAAQCEALLPDAEEIDLVSSALAEGADALLPADTGEQTRAGTVVGALFAVGGVMTFKAALLQQHQAQQQQQAGASDQQAGGDGTA